MKRLFDSLRSISFFRYKSSIMTTLENLKFDNLSLKRLPIDAIDTNYPRTVNGACFSKVSPTPLENPKVVSTSSDAMALLGITESELERRDFAEYFSGNKLLPGSETASHCYCGHQFGYFSGQLGDGAAIYLGEVINAKGERWEIQLKGAGLTPYSRTADGRKVLRSSIREFLCSEAMHFLGIPTTRAGACITSDTKVIRDIFYDNHPKEERCSTVLRIAPTFMRFGSFEIFKTMDPVTGRVGPSVGRTEILHTMLDYVIENFFPEINSDLKDQVERYKAFFKDVVLRTANLVALWQCVGFCHGVLNTDNMSILGLTIDYGPFGFLDMYDPDHICNASDNNGRYSFSKQPEICLWNLRKFAEAIQQALPLNESLPLLELYDEKFKSTYINKMRNKLGLLAVKSSNDEELIDSLMLTMEKTGADFTNTFLSFCCEDAFDISNIQKYLDDTLQKVLQNCYPLEVLISSNDPGVGPMQIRAFKAIIESDPRILDQLGGHGAALRRVMSVLQKRETFEKMSPEGKTENDKRLWKAWFCKYKERLKEDFDASDKDEYKIQRLNIMKENNPRFILRNYIAQEAIAKAEKGDFSQVRKVLEALKNPYEPSHFQYKNQNFDDNDDSVPSTSHHPRLTCQDQYDKSPDWAFTIKVS